MRRRRFFMGIKNNGIAVADILFIVEMRRRRFFKNKLLRQWQL
jgi:hypothetical protein